MCRYLIVSVFLRSLNRVTWWDTSSQAVAMAMNYVYCQLVGTCAVYSNKETLHSTQRTQGVILTKGEESVDST